MAKKAKIVSYPAELKHELVELVRNGATPEALSAQHGPSAQSIRNWVNAAGRKQAPAAAPPSVEAEVRQLRMAAEVMSREIQMLRQVTKLLLEEAGTLMPSTSPFVVTRAHTD